MICEPARVLRSVSFILLQLNESGKFPLRRPSTSTRPFYLLRSFQVILFFPLPRFEKSDRGTFPLFPVLGFNRCPQCFPVLNFPSFQGRVQVLFHNPWIYAPPVYRSFTGYFFFNVRPITFTDFHRWLLLPFLSARHCWCGALRAPPFNE